MFLIEECLYSDAGDIVTYLGRNFRGQPAAQAEAERCTGACQRLNMGRLYVLGSNAPEVEKTPSFICVC